MAQYELNCKNCNYSVDVLCRFEDLQKEIDSEKAKTNCNNTGEQCKLTRAISSVVFRGQQDYRKMSHSERQAFDTKMKKRSKDHAKKEGVDEQRRLNN
jgi:predicted nucleic acid-binding Zn ribbon protein